MNGEIFIITVLTILSVLAIKVALWQIRRQPGYANQEHVTVKSSIEFLRSMMFVFLMFSAIIVGINILHFIVTNAEYAFVVIEQKFDVILQAIIFYK